MKKIIIFILLLTTFNLSFNFQETIISFGNSNIEILSNEEVIIPIKVDNIKNLYGYSIYIEFEPENLKIIEIKEGDFLKKDSQTFFLSKVDLERREIIVGCARRGNVQGVSGSGVLFNIKILLKEKNKTFLKFKEITLKDNNLNDLIFKSIDLNISPKLQDIPILKFEPTVLVFKSLDEILEIKISNIGKGVLKGTVYTKDDWVVLNKTNFEGNNNIIYVAIKKQSIEEGTIFIESNGGNGVIKVKFEKLSTTKIVLQIGNQIAYVNDKSYLLPFPPFLEKGRTMVPLRFISENRGAQVLWVKEENKAIIIFNEVYIELWVDQNKNYVRMNGVFYTIDVAPYTLKGRTVVPVRFVSEFLGGKVFWNQDTKTVTIYFES
ncbi:MAG: stalk domain-containing protein [Caldisericia bacterium]|nr:stalk domain-containing protein [Caldisericia bacterium]